jgi:hypothetical protein
MKLLLSIPSRETKSELPFKALRKLMFVQAIENENDCILFMAKVIKHPTALAMEIDNFETKIMGEKAKRCVDSSELIRDALDLKLLDFKDANEIVELWKSSKNKQWLERKFKTFVVECLMCKSIGMKCNATFFGWSECIECRGWVCPKCNCQQYHLSNQTQIFEAIEARDKSGKERTKGRRKAKNKRKTLTRQKNLAIATVGEQGEAVTAGLVNVVTPDSKSTRLESGDECRDETITVDQNLQNSRQPPPERVDFVSYLEETNSIIALAGLMDDLGENGYDFDGY